MVRTDANEFRWRRAIGVELISRRSSGTKSDLSKAEHEGFAHRDRDDGANALSHAANAVVAISVTETVENDAFMFLRAMLQRKGLRMGLSISNCW